MTAVDTNAIVLVAGPVLIQNLGPDNLYVGSSDMNDTPSVDSTGFYITAGESVSVQSTTTKVSVVSAGTSDVRYLPHGTGVYASAPTPAP